MSVVTITSTDTSVTCRPEYLHSVTLYHATPGSPNRSQASIVLVFVAEKDIFGSSMSQTRQLLYDTDAAAEEAYAAVAAAMEAVAQ